MRDQEEFYGYVFLALLGLTVVVGLLGTSVLTRLRNAGKVGSSSGTTLAAVLLFVLAFFSTVFPYLALIPALGFFIFGFMAFNKGTLPRDGGIVLLLTGLAWCAFTAIQKDTLASGADIRVDLIITLPIMSFMGSTGWKIGSLLR
jgi:hypothetical protein